MCGYDHTDCESELRAWLTQSGFSALPVAKVSREAEGRDELAALIVCFAESGLNVSPEACGLSLNPEPVTAARAS